MEWSIETILSLVGSLGFPVIVAWYLLTTLKKTIEANTASNVAMQLVLTKICQKLDIDN